MLLLMSHDPCFCGGCYNKTKTWIKPAKDLDVATLGCLDAGHNKDTIYKACERWQGKKAYNKDLIP